MLKIIILFYHICIEGSLVEREEHGALDLQAESAIY